MDFLKNTLNKIPAFFDTYNYSSAYIHIYDNYVPNKFAKAMSAAHDIFTNNVYNNSYLNYLLENVINYFLSLINTNYYFLKISNIFLSFGVPLNTVDALSMSFKFLVCIALLIFARGGIPRFRFDYLTKLG